MHVTEVLMDKISPARNVAFEVLRMVQGGAYASDSLRAFGHSLDARDAALASQIVFGCLRFEYQLDYLVSFYSGRQPASLDAVVRIALRAAIFQILYLERVPPHAAVHESVEFVKRHKRAAAGFTNAVLRKVNRIPRPAWPDETTGLSCPPWLLERWTAHFGAEQARAIAKAALQEPAAYIRVPPGQEPPSSIQAEPTSVEGSWRLLSPSRGMRLHDISSQAIIPVLDLRPRMTYLDLCAAPGNKTLQAIESSPALAIACDVSERRIRDIPAVCPRVVLDAARPLPFSRSFDRIFIDAPCSGTGTLARNPEIKSRVQPHDLKRFHDTQLQIVTQALTVLAPGGKLLYATCSLEREENEDVIRQTLAAFPELRCERDLWRLPSRDEGDGFYAALLVG